MQIMDKFQEMEEFWKKFEFPKIRFKLIIEIPFKTQILYNKTIKKNFKGCKANLHQRQSKENSPNRIMVILENNAYHENFKVSPS